MDHLLDRCHLCHHDTDSYHHFWNHYVLLQSNEQKPESNGFTRKLEWHSLDNKVVLFNYYFLTKLFEY